MTDAPIGLALTRNEVELLIEALDSHEYWQPSEPRWRHSGAVVLPYERVDPWFEPDPLIDSELATADQIRQCRELSNVLRRATGP